MAEYKLRYEGTYITKGAYEFQAGAPLDTRSVVTNLKCLISASVWVNQADYVYTGLPVYVESTGEYFMLVNRPVLKQHLFTNKQLDAMTDETAKTHIDLCWGKLAFYKDIETTVKNLGPVFKFKGVAKEISTDQKVITIDTVNYTPINEAESIDITCLGFERGFPDEYYAWGVIDASNNITTYFYSNTQEVDQNTTQYKRTDEEVSIFYAYETERTGKRYYFDGHVANEDASASVDSSVMWKFSDEDDISHIYCVADGGAEEPTIDASLVTFYLDPDTSEPVYARLNIEHFDAVIFEEMDPSECGTINSSTGSSVEANDSNNGWVYQIGKDEYASNGLIWVKLGSAENDWLVI